MDTQTKTSAKDFFLNLGVIVSLYVIVINLLTLLFTVINKAYPQIKNGYNYFGSSTISWPVSTLIIVFPIFVLLVWFLEKGYVLEPQKRHLTVKKWLTYVTLFVSGVAMAVDLITILYYFIDGQELTTAFVLKVIAVLVVTLGVFLYFISEIREKLTSKSRRIWLVVAIVVILASIIWGFSVLGTPRTQRLYKYDEQKINDLINITNEVNNYYSTRGVLPESFTDISPNYYVVVVDSQTQKQYEYKKIDKLTYELCAEFNKPTRNNFDSNYQYSTNLNTGLNKWTHEEGRTCFTEKVSPNLYYKGNQAVPFTVTQ